MSFGQDYFWAEVAGDHDRTQHTASLVHAKVASATWWPFLSHATSERDFDNRLQIVSERLEAAVGTEMYPEVSESLRDDFRAVHEASRASAQSTSPELAEFNSGLASHKADLSADEYFNTSTNRWERLAAETGVPEVDSLLDGTDGGDGSWASPPEDQQRTAASNRGVNDLGHDVNPDSDNPYTRGERKQCLACNGWGKFEGPEGPQCGHCEGKGYVDLKKESAVKEALFHEQYGEVSRPQLAAYKKHNVPPALHDELAGYFGSENHAAITNYVKQAGERGSLNYGDVYKHQPSASGHIRELEEGGGGWGHFGAKEDNRKEATNYQPDPNRAWRYYPGYENIEGANQVNNGALQDSDGFVTDLAQGEDEAAQQRMQFQLTPGTWTAHDGMPERPMPFSQQRGYQPVAAREDYPGFAHGIWETGRAHATQGVPPQAAWPRHTPQHDAYLDGYKHGYAGQHRESSKALVVDADGFLVEALVDPAPGTPQKVNPFYFNTEEAAMGSNQGFPVDPSAEPLADRANDYGDVQPQVSSGSTEGTIDGDGYSRSHPGESPNFNERGAKLGSTDKGSTCDRTWHGVPCQVPGDQADHEVHRAHVFNRPVEWQDMPQWRGVPMPSHPRSAGMMGPTPLTDAQRNEQVRGWGHADGYQDHLDNEPHRGAERVDEWVGQQAGPVSDKHQKLYLKGYDRGHKGHENVHRFGSTDGKIVDHCPGCDKPRRNHTTPHGTETRHIHNDHVRCFGDRTAKVKRASVEDAFQTGAGAGAAGGAGGLDGGGASMNAGVMGGNDNKDLAMEPADDDLQATGAFLPQFFDPTLSSGSVHTADYLGRPDTNNLEGRGDNAFDAKNWEKRRTLHPVQTLEDMNPNTPTDPHELGRRKDLDQRGIPGRPAEPGDDEAEEDEDD